MRFYLLLFNDVHIQVICPSAEFPQCAAVTENDLKQNRSAQENANSCI